MRLVINIVYGGRYIKLVHSTRLTNIYESTIHPAVRRVPPIGVIMPNDLLDVKAIIIRLEEKINTPERNSQPT